ncbi:AaceriAGL285Cp [[Ashbya] aceris (nom. inval.)]|nr:AaceriAGL285Cp [[Ashbya] aceris (nom. inval.)]
MSSSVQSGVLTLLHTACGAGVLAMPYAFRAFGLLAGGAILVSCGACAMAGLVLQSHVAQYVPPRQASFFTLAQISNPELSVVFDCAIAVKCFGVGVSYLVVLGDLMPQILATVTAVPWLLDRNVQITFWTAAVIAPLCCMRHLHSLKYASMVAVAAVAYLGVLVAARAVWPSPELERLRGPVSLGLPPGTSGGAMLSSFPIFVFAYTCHHNMFSIVNELRDNSLAACLRVVVTAIALAVALYATIGGAGYLTFGDNITGNIIAQYPPSPASTLGRAAIAVLVMLAFPLQCHPARASINHIWHYCFPCRAAPPSEASALIGSPPASVCDGPAEEPAAVPLGPRRFAAITAALLLASYAIAVSVTSLARVLAVVGATGSTAISFILPGLFGYQLIGSESRADLLPPRTRFLRLLSLLLAAWGVAVMCAGLSAALLFDPAH